jgi:hypothetical protein
LRFSTDLLANGNEPITLITGGVAVFNAGGAPVNDDLVGRLDEFVMLKRLLDKAHEEELRAAAAKADQASAAVLMPPTGGE